MFNCCSSKLIALLIHTVQLFVFFMFPPILVLPRRFVSQVALIYYFCFLVLSGETSHCWARARSCEKLLGFSVFQEINNYEKNVALKKRIENLIVKFKERRKKKNSRKCYFVARKPPDSLKRKVRSIWDTFNDIKKVHLLKT